MLLEMTTEEQRAVDADAGGTAELVDPRNGVRYTLVRADELDALRRDELDQAALRRAAARNLARRTAADE